MKELAKKSQFNPKYNVYFKTYNSIKAPKVAKSIANIIKATILVLTLFLVFTPWVQTTSGAGKVTSFYPEDRLQNFNAMVNGRIKKWYVREGSNVKKGDPIVEIVDNDPRILERLKAERDAAEKKWEATRIAAETANNDFIRQQELFKKDLSSRKEIEKAKIKYKELLSKQAATFAEFTQAEVKLSRQNSQLIKAPRDGVVVSIFAGDIATFIKEGDVLATFVPEGIKPAVEIFISGRDAPLVYKGRKARLQFEGWPAIQFSGWPSVAVGTFGGIVNVVDKSVSENGLFRVIITEDPNDPWPDSNFLRFGAKANGWILLDTVSLGYELWRKLNNFPPINDLSKKKEEIKK
ncbi:MAG: HlyD family efflux transporter periplasmic adaptor subunit [Rickettsiales bacterium]|nr:HlyD family efflux transporter periplasmic adaptor subunit [Rickettsiales bacterium]